MRSQHFPSVPSRRDFLKVMSAAGAASMLGSKNSAAASSPPALRSVNIYAGTGGMGWFTLVWPVPAVIKNFVSSYAYDDPTKAKPGVGLPDGRELYSRVVDGKTLWSNFGDKKRVSAFVCGTANCCSIWPNSGNQYMIVDGVGGQIPYLPAQATLQKSLRAYTPSLSLKYNGSVAPYPFGLLQGAPLHTSVLPTGYAQLWDSTASTQPSRLAPANNRPFYEESYRSALRQYPLVSYPNHQEGFRSADKGLELLLKQMSSELAPKPGQIDQWCGGTPINNQVADLATALIVTANAFKRNLTAQVTIPAFNDDPVGAFSNVPRVTSVVDSTARILQAFMDDLSTVSDPVASQLRLSETVMITVTGDNARNPFTASGWPNATPGGANWTYVMSQGFLKPGWFGDVRANGKTNFNPQTGAVDAAVTTQICTDATIAAMLYATSVGNRTAVRTFYRGASIDGLILA